MPPSTNPHWHQFSRRDLSSDWNAVNTATADGRGGNQDNGNDKWVKVGAIRFFPVDGSSVGLRVGTSYFFGCTIFVATGTRGFYFGHLAQVAGGCIPLESAESTEEQLIPQIENNGDVETHKWTALTPPGDGCQNRWAIIMGTVLDNTEDQGPYALKEFFKEQSEFTPSVPPGNVLYSYYTPGGGGVADPAGPRGKALVTVDDGGAAADGRQTLVLKVYMSNDVPRLEVRFTVDDGQPLRAPETGVTVVTSDITTTGNKVYP